MSIDVHLDGSLRVRYGQFTTAGLRPVNEDCLGIRIPEGELLAVKGLALVIADGVSAADAGKEAGEICVLGFLNDYYATPDDWPVKPAATRVLSSLNEWLFSEGGLFSEDRKDLICALSALVLQGRSVHVFHVGDTRVYRMRGAVLEQVTQDHTARGTGSRRFLARAMGLDLDLALDHWREDAHEGDVYLLTTDGVHDHVGRREMEDLVAAGSDDLDQICRSLGELALQRGSTDNLSAQLIRVESLPAATRREFFEERLRLPVPPDLEPGHTVDGYKVLEVLEAGPFSRTYLVRHVAGGAGLVLKAPSQALADDASGIERFAMEEWIGRCIDEPHLVRVVERRGRPNFLYYLREHVAGESVAVWTERNPLPEHGQVVDVLELLVRGLRAFHRRGHLHQNLRPENVVIQPDGTVKISDLGLTCITGGQDSRRWWAGGRAAATLCHLAPEYRLGKRPSARSDLFSLALLAYGMLTGGKHPYGEAFDAAATEADFGRLRYVPAARMNPAVPGWLDDTLRKALSLNPAQRHEALSEFIADLRRRNPDHVDAADRPLRERSPTLFWLGLAAVLLVGALLLGGL